MRRGPRAKTIWCGAKCRPQSSTSWSALLLSLALGAPAACTTGSGPGDGDGDPDGPVGPIDFPSFVQDRPAVGGDWYLYDEDGGHTLTPFEHAYLVREDTGSEVRYGAVRIVTYYDPDTAESGLFTFRYATWDGAGWSDATEHVAGHNIKAEGPLCFDLFAGEEAPCTGSAWQVSFKIYRFLVRTGPITVARPGLFLREAPRLEGREPVFAATVESTTGLDQLPDPTQIDELETAAPGGWDDPDYDLGLFAPNLPEAGRVLGARYVDEGFVGRPDVYFLLSTSTELVRFTVTPATEGDPTAGLVFRAARQLVDRNELEIQAKVPDPVEVTVAAPAEGQVTFLDFNEPDLLLDPALVDEAHPPQIVPDEGQWELALTWEGNELHLLLSSGAILYNATAQDGATDLVEATPPL